MKIIIFGEKNCMYNDDDFGGCVRIWDAWSCICYGGDCAPEGDN